MHISLQHWGGTALKVHGMCAFKSRRSLKTTPIVCSHVTPHYSAWSHKHWCMWVTSLVCVQEWPCRFTHMHKCLQDQGLNQWKVFPSKNFWIWPRVKIIRINICCTDRLVSYHFVSSLAAHSLPPCSICRAINKGNLVSNGYILENVSFTFFWQRPNVFINRQHMDQSQEKTTVGTAVV